MSDTTPLPSPAPQALTDYLRTIYEQGITEPAGSVAHALAGIAQLGLAAPAAQPAEPPRQPGPAEQWVYFRRDGHIMEDCLVLPVADDPTRHVRAALITRIVAAPPDAVPANDGDPSDWLRGKGRAPVAAVPAQPAEPPPFDLEDDQHEGLANKREKQIYEAGRKDGYSLAASTVRMEMVTELLRTRPGAAPPPTESLRTARGFQWGPEVRGAIADLVDAERDLLSATVVQPAEPPLALQPVEPPLTRQERGELEIRRGYMDRLPFCPDHRDKVRGLSCRQCEIERLTSKLARAAVPAQPAESAAWRDSIESFLAISAPSAMKVVTDAHMVTIARNIFTAILATPLNVPAESAEPVAWRYLWPAGEECIKPTWMLTTDPAILACAREDKLPIEPLYATPPNVTAESAVQVDEGCTPADARVLRFANHALAQESHELQDVLADLYGQVKRFCEAHGEADFETGRALYLLSRVRPMEFHWPFAAPPNVSSSPVSVDPAKASGSVPQAPAGSDGA